MTLSGTSTPSSEAHSCAKNHNRHSLKKRNVTDPTRMKAPSKPAIFVSHSHVFIWWFARANPKYMIEQQKTTAADASNLKRRNQGWIEGIRFGNTLWKLWTVSFYGKVAPSENVSGMPSRWTWSVAHCKIMAGKIWTLGNMSGRTDAVAVQTFADLSSKTAWAHVYPTHTSFRIT